MGIVSLALERACVLNPIFCRFFYIFNLITFIIKTGIWGVCSTVNFTMSDYEEIAVNSQNDEEMSDYEEIAVNSQNDEEICRICASESGDGIEFLSIFEEEAVRYDLAGKIHRYLNIRVTKYDSFPTSICCSCAFSLISWNKLYELCRKVNTSSFKHSEEKYDVEMFDCCENDENMPLPPINLDDTDTPECQSFDDLMASMNVGNVENNRGSDIGEPSGSHVIPITCDYCDETCLNLIDLLHHLKRSHAKNRKERNIYEEVILETFIREEEVGKVFKCDKCEFKSPYPKKYGLFEHYSVHFDQFKPFVCYYCGKEMRLKRNLIRHIKNIHEKENKRKNVAAAKENTYFVCDCGKTFKWKKNMLRHAKVHRIN